MKTSKSAFTLIELLVVIAIIAILAAILFPVFGRARAKARVTACVSNMKQIGLGVQQYIQDYDGYQPIYYAYNSIPSAGNSGHKGVELILQPYTKSLQIFKCPEDIGGPAVLSSTIGCALEPDKQDSYHSCYGSSYKFQRRLFSVVAGETTENNSTSAYTTDALVKDTQIVFPAESRIMRDEMFSFFGPEGDPSGTKYGYYSATPANNFYRQWHTGGGTVLFADGHAKFIPSATTYDTLKDRP